MKDKMMRVAGRDSAGKARALNADAEGNLGVRIKGEVEQLNKVAKGWDRQEFIRVKGTITNSKTVTIFDTFKSAQLNHFTFTSNHKNFRIKIYPRDLDGQPDANQEFAIGNAVMGNNIIVTPNDINNNYPTSKNSGIFSLTEYDEGKGIFVISMKNLLFPTGCLVQVTSWMVPEEIKYTLTGQVLYIA